MSKIGGQRYTDCVGDGISGFVEAIHVAFPNTEVQRCIISQIRASTRYVSYKDLKVFTADLKSETPRTA